MRIINFIICLLFIIICIVLAIFCLLFSSSKYLDNRKLYIEKKIPKKHRIVLQFMVWFMRCFAVLLLIYFIVPFSLDIPRLFSGNFEKINGYVTMVETSSRKSWSTKTIKIDNEEKFYYYIGPKVEVGQKVTIIYLPHSKYVVDIIE